MIFRETTMDFHLHVKCLEGSSRVLSCHLWQFTEDLLGDITWSRYGIKSAITSGTGDGVDIQDSNFAWDVCRNGVQPQTFDGFWLDKWTVQPCDKIRWYTISRPQMSPDSWPRTKNMMKLVSLGAICESQLKQKQKLWFPKQSSNKLVICLIHTLW